MSDQSTSNNVTNKERIAAYRGFLQGRPEFFCNYLKLLIRKAGYTQTQLAYRLIIDNSTVSHWLNGSRMPDAAMIYQICLVLDLSEEQQEALFISFFSAKHADDIIKIIDQALLNSNALDTTVEVTSKIIRTFFYNNIDQAIS